MRRDLFKKGLNQSKMLFSFQRDQTANSQTITIGSPTLPTPDRQISDLLPAFGSFENQTNSDFSLSPHLAHFLARLVGCPRFRFVDSWIFGLAIGGEESKGADVTISFSG